MPCAAIMPTLRGRLADFIRGAATTTTTKMKVPTKASIKDHGGGGDGHQARSLPSHLIIWLPTALEIHQNKLHAFMSVMSTSEVFGKGFSSL